MQRDGWCVEAVTTTTSRRGIGLLFGIIGYWILPKKTVYHVTFSWADIEPPVGRPSGRSRVAGERADLPPSDAATSAVDRRPWWQHEAAIAWAMMLAAPVGLVLMWRYGPWRVRTKLLWSVAYPVAALGVIILALSPSEDTIQRDTSASAAAPNAIAPAVTTTPPTPTPTPTPKPRKIEDTTEYKLAVVARGAYVQPSDPIVARLGDWLDTLSSRCTEDRTLIADMIVRTQQLLKSDRRMTVPVEQITRDLLEATAEVPRMECSGLLAALIALY